MGHMADSIPADSMKKLDNRHHPITIAVIGITLFIAILIFFSTAGVQEPNSPGNASGIGPMGSTTTMAPTAIEMPVAEIATKSVICQVTGMLSISGTVKSNVNHQISVEIAGASYDSNDAEMGTGYDTVTIDPHGISTYTVNILDGCQLGDTGTYDVRLVNINWRHTD